MFLASFGSHRAMGRKEGKARRRKERQERAGFDADSVLPCLIFGLVRHCHLVLRNERRGKEGPHRRGKREKQETEKGSIFFRFINIQSLGASAPLADGAAGWL